MSSDIIPSFGEFQSVYGIGRPQLVYTRLINDMDTPVSAYLKIAKGKPYAFLFESVQGGEQRGRYSFMGFSPDLIWRSFGDASECARGDDSFKPLTGNPLDSLRTIQTESAFDLPEGIPPMASGLFGYLGYDMVRQVEKLPNINSDPIGTPDAIMTRPTIVAIFDQIAQEITITTTVYPNNLSAQSAYDAALKRLEAVVHLSLIHI